MRGVLLVNIGTPEEPEPAAVGRYLRKFLMDRFVIDVPFLLRWLLVNVVIVPIRKYKSARAYQKIWTKRGSPLLFHMQDLAVKLSEQFSVTAIGMRYSEPSIEMSMRRLIELGVNELVVFPLYPQYAESSTRSSREEVLNAARRLDFKKPIHFVEEYHAHPAYIASFARVIREQLAGRHFDHLLMSYHGLPLRHVQRLDQTKKVCGISPDCCDARGEHNWRCYRAQCFATTKLLTEQLGLERSRVSVSFQSRLGRAQWLEPNTEAVIQDLAKKGIKHLAVVCPSFTIDCLETIEEIGVRATELFVEAGGTELTLIPCLNSDEQWAEAIPQIISSSARSLTQ